MADELSGKKVAILAADGVERVELVGAEVVAGRHADRTVGAAAS